MSINAIWLGLFVIAYFVGLAKLIFLHDASAFPEIIKSCFASAKLAFEVALGLTGVMTLWLGILRVGEQAGVLNFLTRGLQPLLLKLFPQVPVGHPAFGSMTMNMAANMLGLDNAATPIGIKAMHELQSLNPKIDEASDAQVLFLVINASSITLLPVTIFNFRAQLGALNPTDVFVPILISTYISTVVGLMSVAYFQQLNLFQRTIMMSFGFITLIIAGLVSYFAGLDNQTLQIHSAALSTFLLFSLIMLFLLSAAHKAINSYAVFVEGAKEGFQTAIGIIPYLVAMLVAVAVFRASGAMEYIISAIRYAVLAVGLDSQFVDALPTALIKPLSGSGARAMMIDTMKTFGADSFVGRLVCVIQGSTETTFYVVAVYFGAVGIKNVRHAVVCGLLADLAGVLSAIGICYQFFGEA